MLQADLRKCFRSSDVAAQQLVAKLVMRNQFHDESLQSYANVLYNWAERIHRVQPSTVPIDWIVMHRFVDGLHNTQVLAELKKAVKQCELRG